MRCAIWYQTLKNGIRIFGQNAVLTSWNALERLSQKSVSLNPFPQHSNSYLTFNHLHGMYMTLEWHTHGISRKYFELFHSKVAVKPATLKADGEIKVRGIFRFKTFI